MYSKQNVMCFCQRMYIFGHLILNSRANLEAKRKSQKLFPFINMAIETSDILHHLRDVFHHFNPYMTLFL